MHGPGIRNKLAILTNHRSKMLILSPYVPIITEKYLPNSHLQSANLHQKILNVGGLTAIPVRKR